MKKIFLILFVFVLFSSFAYAYGDAMLNCTGCSNDYADYWKWDDGDKAINNASPLDGAYLVDNGWTNIWRCENTRPGACVYTTEEKIIGNKSFVLNETGEGQRTAKIDMTFLKPDYVGLIGFWVKFKNMDNSLNSFIRFGYTATDRNLGVLTGTAGFWSYDEGTSTTIKYYNNTWVWVFINCTTNGRMRTHINNTYVGEKNVACGNTLENLQVFTQNTGNQKMYIDGLRITKNNSLGFPSTSIVPDTTPPTYNNFGNNGSATANYKNAYIQFTINMSDNVALSSYKFADNQSGTFTNRSAVAISGTSYVANVYVNATTNPPKNICGKFWFNDTNNNQNQSSLSCFNTIPKLTLYQPLNNSFNRGNPLQFNFTFDFNATSCYLCLNLSGVFTCPSNLTTGEYNLTIYNTSYTSINGTENVYRFEENSGSVIIDTNGKINGTNVNSATYQSSKGGNGTGDYSLQFNGATQYLDLGTAGNYERTQHFSISVWVKTSSTPAVQSLIVGKIDNTLYRGWEIFQVSNNINFAMLNAITNYVHIRDTNFSINTGVWRFITITYDGSSTASGTKMYIDGVFHTTDIIKDNLGGTIITSQNLKVANDNVNYYYNGLSDEVILYNITLNSSQVLDIYNNGVLSLINTSSIVTLNGTLTPDLNTTLNYTFANITRGNFNSYINCKDGTDINSSFVYFGYDNDFYAPSINLTSPIYNETYNVPIWINFTTNEYSVCVINETNFNLNYSNNSVFIYLSTSALTSGTHTILLNCTDLSGNSAYQTLFFTKDITYPYIYIYSPVNSSNIEATKTTLRLNMSFLDERELYDYSINITYFDDNSETTLIIYNESGIISGYSWYNLSELIPFGYFPNNTWFRITARTCDSHTANLISDAKRIVKTKSKITFNLNKADISVESLSGEELSADSKKLDDRYSFDFKYAKVYPQKKYRLTSSFPLHYLENSDIKGHFVVKTSPMSGYWVDFEQEGYTKVEKIDEYTFDIIIDNENLDVKFNSIGELNCVEATSVFTKGKVTAPSFLLNMNFSLDNIGNVIFFLALVILFLGVWIIAYWFKNFGFASLGFFIGIIIGFLLTSVHLFFFFLFVFINVTLFIQFGRTKK